MSADGVSGCVVAALELLLARVREQSCKSSALTGSLVSATCWQTFYLSVQA